jgi:hypothetical protein
MNGLSACHILRPRWLGAVSAVLLAAQVGCGASARVTIIQPALPSPQDEVRLRSSWAYAADDEVGVERIVLMFPLPGARAGDRRFFIYLRVPGKRRDPMRIGEPLPGGGRVSGFFIQATGRFAGKTVFADGQIELRGVALDRGSRRRGKIDLHCLDGSWIQGEFVARVAPLEVIDFEDSKAGDVRELIRADPPGDQEQPGGGPTAGEDAR